MLLSPLMMVRAQTGAYIQGKGSQGWEINIQGSRGTFQANGETWDVEYILNSLGQNNFANTLWFLGRKSQNYLLLFVSVNTEGTVFEIDFFDYQKNSLPYDKFQGNYNITGLRAAPTKKPNYVPEGKVPDYQGVDFRVSSPYSQVSPAEGKVSFIGFNLIVYPTYHLMINSNWSEFWGIGLDPKTSHTYHLIYYTNNRQAWLVDLWTGQVNDFPLGQAAITGGKVYAPHPVTLSAPK